MKVADLFVDITLKGGNKVADGLSGVKNWLTDITASGLAAKAAIIGAVYALERMTKASGQFGNDVKNLSVLTGIDTTKIQQWAEYMRLGGASAEDAHQALLAASKTQAEIAKGNYPSGLGRILSVTQTNLQDVINNPLKFAEMVKKYIETSKEDISLINNAVESVGGTAGFITAVRRNPGKDIYNIKANIADENQIKKLAQVNQAWSDFEKTLSRFRDTLTADWGLPLINGLNKALEIAKELSQWLGKIFNTGSASGVLKKGAEAESALSKRARGALHGIFGAPPQGQKTSQNNTINVYQNGVEDTHDSVSEFKSEIARAFYSINTIGLVA